MEDMKLRFEKAIAERRQGDLGLLRLRGTGVHRHHRQRGYRIEEVLKKRGRCKLGILQRPRG